MNIMVPQIEQHPVLAHAETEPADGIGAETVRPLRNDSEKLRIEIEISPDGGVLVHRMFQQKCEGILRTDGDELERIIR